MFPATAHYTQAAQTNHHHNKQKNWRPSYNNTNYEANRTGQNNCGPKTYLGRCQACGTHDHTTKQCPQFRIVSQTNNGTHCRNTSGLHMPTMRWWALLNHHLGFFTAVHLITYDLANMSMHTPYNGGEEFRLAPVLVQVTLTGLSTLPSTKRSFYLNYVLRVPQILKNLVSVNIYWFNVLDYNICKHYNLYNVSIIL